MREPLICAGCGHVVDVHNMNGLEECFAAIEGGGLCQCQRFEVNEDDLPTAEDVRGILPKPEPEQSVPLSAIRALVQQWTERAAMMKANKHTFPDRFTYETCAHELAALCPAPEDQK